MDLRERVIERIIADTGMGETAAASELRLRVKRVKGILALDNYLEWARENNILLGGPRYDVVNSERVQALLDSKPYRGPGPLVLGFWDLIDLSNVRYFNRWRQASGITLPLDEVLLLKRTEYVQLKEWRVSLVRRRSRESDNQSSVEAG